MKVEMKVSEFERKTSRIYQSITGRH